MEDDRILGALRAGHLDDATGELSEADRLRAENEELRAVVAELRQMLEESASNGTPALNDQDRDYERLLEEKSEVIRQLHLRIQELEKQVAAGGGPAVPVPNERDLLELSDELERERCQLEQEQRQLEQERRQLLEDEETMTQQMREMEMQMSRERAEMARQRNELQRLHNEIRHELEMAQRDSLLNERLRSLQRRHQDVTNRRGAEPDQPVSQQPVQPAPAPQPRKDSGIFSSLFGRRK